MYRIFCPSFNFIFPDHFICKLKESNPQKDHRLTELAYIKEMTILFSAALFCAVFSTKIFSARKIKFDFRMSHKLENTSVFDSLNEIKKISNRDVTGISENI